LNILQFYDFDKIYDM